MLEKLILISLFVVMPGVCRAQEPVEKLPRVLILGDSTYQQPAAEVTKLLVGKAEIVFARIPAGETRNSSSAVKNLDQWLGEEKWDLIHFNFGLGDLVYRAPNMKSFRVLPKYAGGVRATSPEEYKENLGEIVERLKTTEAKLIWASTTPIRHSQTKVFEMGSEIEYNSIANKVMKANEIPISDMYTYVFNLIDMTRPAGHGFDPFTFDKKPIHAPLLSAVIEALAIRVDVESNDPN